MEIGYLLGSGNRSGIGLVGRTPWSARDASSRIWHNGISPWRGARGRRGRRPQRGPPGPGVRPTGLPTISHRRRAWRISHPPICTTVSVPGVAQEADGGVVPRGDPLVLGSAPLACTLFHIAAGLGEFRILRSAQRYQSLAWRKRPTGASSPEGTPWSWGPPHWLAHYFTSPPGLANFAS